jgi:hypothetical protein
MPVTLQGRNALCALIYGVEKSILLTRVASQLVPVTLQGPNALCAFIYGVEKSILLTRVASIYVD